MNTEPDRKPKRIPWYQFLLSVRTKYTLTLLTVVLIPLSIYTALEIRRLRQALEDTGLKALEASVRYKGAIVDGFLERGIEQTLTISNLPSLIRYLDQHELPADIEKGEIRSDLRSLKLVNQVFISSVAILDAKGLNRVDTNEASEGEWEDNQEYFIQPLLTGTPEVTLQRSDEAIEGLFFSSVIYDGDYPLGILRIKYSPQVLKHLLIEESSLLSSTATPLLYDQSGRILAGGIRAHRSDGEGRTRQGVGTIEDYGLSKISIGSHPTVIAKTNESERAEQYALAMTRLDFADWNFAYVQPYADFVEPALRQTRLAVISGVTVIIIIGGFGLASAHFLLAPLGRLKTAALKIARGDLDARVTVTTRDEIGDVGRTFNEMAERLSQRETALTKAKIQAEEANRAKSQFLAVMSHEIRTPLNSIIGFSTLLSENESLTEQQSKDVSRITRAGHNLLKLINDILDFSKIEAGRLKLDWQMVFLDQTLSQAAEMVLPLLAKRPVEFFIHVDDEVPLEILSDEQRLNQILTNLLTNAAKFTEEGRIDLSLSISDNPEEICISVRDTGIGISEKVRGKLFQAFSQGDSSNTRKYGGTGLGLVICSRLSKAMGGNVCIDPKIKDGARLELKLPIRKRSEEKLSPQLPKNNFIRTNHSVVILGTNTESLSHHANVLEKSGIICKQVLIESLVDLREAADLTILDLDNLFSIDDLSDTQIAHFKQILSSQKALVLSNASGAALLELNNETEVRRIAKPLLPSQFAETVLEMLGEPNEPPEVQSLENVSGALPRGIGEFRALVVEDDLMSGTLMRKILQDIGATVTVESDAVSAIGRTKDSEFDIIVTDIHMPGMNGFEFVDFLSTSLSKVPPIIATTADLEEKTKKRAIQSKITELVYKPINTSKFIALIESELSLN